MHANGLNVVWWCLAEGVERSDVSGNVSALLSRKQFENVLSSVVFHCIFKLKSGDQRVN